jgi:surface antigen
MLRRAHRRLPLAGMIGLLLSLCLASTPANAASIVGAQAGGNTQQYAPAVITANPYQGVYGPPNCTWYSWQRLHVMERIDLQFTANAADWISAALNTHAAWSEVSNSYGGVTSNTTPQAGDLVVFPYQDGVWAFSSAGHVAYVEAVNGDTILISQQSFGDYKPGPNTIPYPYVSHYSASVTSIQRSQQGHARFLHFSAGAPPPPQAIDNAALVEQSSNPTAQVDQSVRIHFTVRNSGTTTWTEGDGYQFVELLGACQACTPVTIRLGGSTVAPGQQVTFTFDLNTGPGGPCASGNTTCGGGAWTTLWSMFHSDRAFGPSLQITVYSQSAPPPVTCSASSNGVTLYVDSNYSGACHTFGPGEYSDLAQYGLDANSSSIWNPGNAYHVTLFDQKGLTGTPAYWDSSAPSFSGYWNDRGRSLRVEVHGPPAPTATSAPPTRTPAPPPSPTVTVVPTPVPTNTPVPAPKLVVLVGSCTVAQVASGEAPWLLSTHVQMLNAKAPDAGTGYPPYPPIAIRNDGTAALDWTGTTSDNGYPMTPSSGSVGPSLVQAVDISGPAAPSGPLTVNISSNGGAWQGLLPPCN